MHDPTSALLIVCALFLTAVLLSALPRSRRRPSPMTDWVAIRLFAVRLWLWRGFLRWPRPLAYKLLVLLCLVGALAEGSYILFIAPPPYAVATTVPGTLSVQTVAAPPTVMPTPPSQVGYWPTPMPTNTAGTIAVPTLLPPTAIPAEWTPSAVLSSTATPAASGLQTSPSGWPGLHNVQFVSEPDDGVAPLLSVIDAAHRELDGEIYLLSDPTIEAALGDAVTRGVRVRIILERQPYGGDTGSPLAAYNYLTGHGVHVEWGGTAFRFTHAKMLVADGARAWIGTLNWTPTSFTRNRDFAAVVDDPTVVRSTMALFDADWAGLPVNTLAPGLVVSPLNARMAIMNMIEGAGYTIDVYAEVITDPQVVQALAVAEQRGVRVRVVYNDGSNLSTLTAAGVRVRRVTYPHYIHAKAIVADGNKLFLGSENLTATSLDKNREVGVLLRDRLAISLVEQPFAEDFERGRDYLPPVAVLTPSPVATPLPGFAVQAWVTPDTMRYDAYPVLYARSVPGATCTANVVYSTGYPPVSFHGIPQTTGADGTARWGWHQMTKGDSGDATVSCMYHGAVQTTQARFAVTR